MAAAPDNRVNATGGCLCGAVRYGIIGDLRGIVNCHCSKCRRFHGNFGAFILRYDFIGLDPGQHHWIELKRALRSQIFHAAGHIS